MEIRSLQSLIRINKMARELDIRDLCTRMVEKPIEVPNEAILKVLKRWIRRDVNEDRVFGEIEGWMGQIVYQDMKFRRHLHEDTITEVLLDAVDLRMGFIHNAWNEYCKGLDSGEIVDEYEEKVKQNQKDWVSITTFEESGVETDD